MSDSRVTPAWNFKGMLMENNSRVITNADATLTQKIYDYGEVSPEQSSVTVVKDDDMAHFYFNICSEKGEPAYIKITKDDDGNIVIIGTDHSGTTQQTILASKIELTENDKGVLISVLATENGELIKKEAQIYDSTISVEEKDYGALVTMTNSKGTSSEAKLYSPTISAERLEDNTGVKIIITSGKEGVTPTVVNLYDPIVTGKRVTGGAEITIQNHIDEEPQIINLYDAGSSSFAPEYNETQEYKKFDYCMYNNIMYVCLENTTGPFDETKWKETKVSYELDNVSLKIVAEDWDGSKTYSIGDYVMYDKILYKCISNEEGSETAYPNITTSKWKTIFIMDEIPNIATTEKAGIVKVGNNLTIEEDGTLSANADLSIIAEEWDNQKQYNTGDYVIYDNILYKCITDKQGWTLEYDNPNPDYTWITANEAICNLGGRVFYKTNNEVAYGGWNIRPDGWANPMLVATSESAVAYTPYGPVNTTVEILGTTFYLTYSSNGSMKNRSSGGRALEIPYYEDYTEQTIEILKLANVYVVSDKPGPNSDKWEKVLVMNEIKNKQSTVPIASAETAGIVKVGKNLEITEDGTLNAKAGGGNANEMELTWAEYLALTDEEKNNGTTYYITDKNPTSSEKGFKSTLLATLNDQPQEIDFSNYDLILYQAYNSEVNLYSSAVFMPSFINRAGNIILSIDVTDRIIIDSTNAITLNAFNCAIDVYGMNFIGSGGEGGSGLPEVYIGDIEPTDNNIQLFVDTSASYEPTENYSETVLWEAGTPLQTDGIATLSDSYFNYHALYIYRSTPGDKETSPAHMSIYTVPISALKEGLEVGSEGYFKRYIYIKGSTDGMSINCIISGTDNSENVKYNPAIYKIVGIKYKGLTLVEQSGGVSSLADLTDVYIQNLKDKQILSYNSSTKKWENIEVGFSSDVKYAKLYFTANTTVKPTSTTAPLIFDTTTGNLEIIDNQKVKLEKGKTYLAYIQGMTGNWSNLNIYIRNSQEQKICTGATGPNYTGINVSTIYKCEIDNDYLYYSSTNGGATEGGTSLAYATQFFVVELNGSGSGETSSTNSNQHNYSIEEKVIGTWINGKPIYEKVINGTMIGSPSDWTNFYDCSNLNIDNMISIKGFFNYNNERNIYIDSRYTSFSYVYNTKFIQYYNTGLGQYNFETILIIQYTKTID